MGKAAARARPHPYATCPSLSPSSCAGADGCNYPSQRIDCAAPSVENDSSVEENQWQPRFKTFKTWPGFRTNVAAIQVVLRLTRFDSADNENVTKPKNARAMPKKCQMTGRCDASSVRIARWREWRGISRARGVREQNSIWLVTHFRPARPPK